MAGQIRPGDTWGVGMSTQLPLVALSLCRAVRGFEFKIYLPERATTWCARRRHAAGAC